MEERTSFGTTKMNIQDKIEEIESDEKLLGIYTLYALLELAVKTTGRGDISDDYTKEIEFNMGGMTIYINEYYCQLTLEFEDGEHEIKENDEIVESLKEEVKKRLVEFDKKIRKTADKISDEVFNKPLKGELMEAIEGEEEYED